MRKHFSWGLLLWYPIDRYPNGIIVESACMKYKTYQDYWKHEDLIHESNTGWNEVIHSIYFISMRKMKTSPYEKEVYVSVVLVNLF